MGHRWVDSAPLSYRQEYGEVARSSRCRYTQLPGLTRRSVERSTRVRGRSSQTTVRLRPCLGKIRATCPKENRWFVVFSDELNSAAISVAVRSECIVSFMIEHGPGRREGRTRKLTAIVTVAVVLVSAGVASAQTNRHAGAQWQAPYANPYYSQDTRNLRYGTQTTASLTRWLGRF
jgi:hypothetical protein